MDMHDMNPERACGGCTACCKTHGIQSINKPENAWCVHCDIGKGCRRYETRPQECVDFSCSWRMGLGSEADRPDRSRCVIDVHELPEIGPILVAYELREGAIAKSGLVEAMKRMAMNRRICIWLRHVGQRDHFIYPDGMELTEHVRRDLDVLRARYFTYRSYAKK